VFIEEISVTNSAEGSFVPAAAAAAVAEAERIAKDAVRDLAILYAAAAVAAAKARRTEARLMRAALHDELTGLPNRRLLGDRLTQALVRASHSHTMVAVLVIDVDGFKSVNDTLGHQAGDELLTGLAAAMRQGLRREDTCARLGGDEFVVVCEGLTRASDAGVLAGRLESLLATGVRVGDQELPVLVSVGIAISSPDSVPAALLEAADKAMYSTKGRTARL
jgi:diguanylate cyclase (GGDEF)-like protein